MRILVYHPYSFDPGMAVLLDEALERLEEEDHSVLFVTCSGQLAPCDVNAEQSSVRCAECRVSTWLLFRQHCHRQLIHKSLSDFLDRGEVSRIDESTFKYDSIDEVKALEYRGVKIGLGVVSSYVSMTRNLNPAFNRSNRGFFDDALRAAARLTSAAHSMLDRFQPDEVWLFNGRYASLRPMLEVTRARQVKSVVFEVTFSRRRQTQRKVRIPDGLPHEIEKITPLIEEHWNAWSRREDKEAVATAFFNARREGEMASDSVYVDLQDPSLLPAQWDNRKRNFVIFNSSEDEFFCVGESFDRHKLFPSQVDGVRFLVEKAAADPSIHFYLRVHPNLRDVPFSYHTALPRLFSSYRNMTVIPAASPVSTYRLMHNSEKVFVFGSTAGVEAAYWGKPVVLMGGAAYRDLDVVYCPNTLNDLESLIQPRLDPKPRVGALKYALFLYGERGRTHSYVNFDFRELRIGRKRLPLPLCYAYRGSILPYLGVVAFFRLLNFIPHLAFKTLTMKRLSVEATSQREMEAPEIR